MPAGQKAADDDLAAVLLVVVSVLSGRVGNSWSSHGVESFGRLGGIAPGAASDVSGLSFLPVLPATRDTRTADRGQSDCLTSRNKAARKVQLPPHSVSKRFPFDPLLSFDLRLGWALLDLTMYQKHSRGGFCMSVNAIWLCDGSNQQRRFDGCSLQGAGYAPGPLRRPA